MNDWAKRVEENLVARRLLASGQPVLVAVSGGVDSMALLHLLQAASRAHGWKVSVAHFNHRLRGRSSAADESLVRKTARKLGLPVFVGTGDVKAMSQKSGLSTEMAARTLRHEFFAKTALENQIPAVALGHHADDQVELFLLRLMRGAGAEGLAGMKWRAPSPADSRVTLIRPLLGQTREVIRLFAVEHKISWREDASNALLDMQRNRVRQELIPLLKKNYNPAIERAILRAMDILSAEADVVTEAAEKWLNRPSDFDRLPVAVQRRCLQLQLRKLGVPADFDLVEKLRAEAGVGVSFAPGKTVVRDGSGQVATRQAEAVSFARHRQWVALSQSSETQFASLLISWKIRPRRTGSFSEKPRMERFDADKVGDSIVLRHWQPGDRFQPIGMTKPVKLQDWFVNLKIPRDQRRRLVVAATSDGDIFWVEGLRISELFKVSEETRRVLSLEWRKVAAEGGL